MKSFALFASLALGLAACSQGQQPAAPPPLEGAAIGGPFTLTGENGEPVSWSDFDGKYRTLYFGYTFCPDVCPLDTTRNAETTDILAERGLSVTPVFISIDPQRDTPRAVGEFAEVLHEKMIGLTGSPEQVAAASKAYKTYYKAHPAEDDYYLVDHSTFTYLTLPDEGTVGFFRRDLTAEQLADEVGCFLDHTR